jgi:hypothetical protein
MSIVAGYIATIMFAGIGFVISEEIAAGFDELVIGAMRARADVLFPDRESVQSD